MLGATVCWASMCCFVWLRPDELRAQFSGAALPGWTSDAPLMAVMAAGYAIPYRDSEGSLGR